MTYDYLIVKETVRAVVVTGLSTGTLALMPRMVWDTGCVKLATGISLVTCAIAPRSAPDAALTLTSRPGPKGTSIDAAGPPHALVSHQSAATPRALTTRRPPPRRSLGLYSLIFNVACQLVVRGLLRARVGVPVVLFDDLRAADAAPLDAAAPAEAEGKKAR